MKVSDILSWMNDNSGLLSFLTVLISFVACFFSFRSAKAAWAQVKEMRIQYAEENRPHIEVEFLFTQRTLYGLRFVNHGKTTAQNVEICLDDEFINSLGNTNLTELLKKQKGKRCVIGVDQHYDLFFADAGYRQISNKVPASGTIQYESNGQKYHSNFGIDTENYATFFSIESNEEKFLKEVKEQTNQLKRIKEGICDIARNTESFHEAEEL